jgi:hypothetical protein
VRDADSRIIEAIVGALLAAALLLAAFAVIAQEPAPTAPSSHAKPLQPPVAAPFAPRGERP